MKGLADAKWTEVATAAVACVAPAVTWLTFLMTHGDKLAADRTRRIEELYLLRGAVDAIRGAIGAIRPWAQTEYTDQSHDPAWYNASWAVLPPPLDAERFRELIEVGQFPEGLRAAAVRLEAAVRRFHEMLAEQSDYRSRAPRDIALRWPAVVAASQAKGGPLDDDDLPLDADHRWLSDLYQRNKAIHEQGIGGRGGDGLHEALRHAAAEIEPARQRFSEAARALGAPTPTPQWVRWGHVLAGAFVVAGVILLSAFFWTVGAAVLHRVFRPRPPAAVSVPEHGSRASAPRDSTTLQANPADVPHQCPPQPKGPQIGKTDPIMNAAAPRLRRWERTWQAVLPEFKLDSLYRVGTASALHGYVGPLSAYYPPDDEHAATYDVLGAASPDGRYKLVFDWDQYVSEGEDGKISIGGEPDSAPLLLDMKSGTANIFESCGTPCGFLWGTWLSPTRFALAGWQDADDYGQWVQGRLAIYSIPDSSQTTYATRIISGEEFMRYRARWEASVAARYRVLKARSPKHGRRQRR